MTVGEFINRLTQKAKAMCTEKVSTMEYVVSIKGKDVTSAFVSGIDNNSVLKLSEFMIKSDERSVFTRTLSCIEAFMDYNELPQRAVLIDVASDEVADVFRANKWVEHPGRRFFYGNVHPLILNSSTPLFSSLLVAAQNGRHQVISNLIKARVNTDQTKINGTTALMLASKNGHHRCVRELIENGASIDSTNSESWTALMYACDEGHNGVARALIKAGADVNAIDETESTALMYASTNGHDRVVKTLIESNALLEEISDEWNSLMLASRHGHDRVVKALISSDASLEKKNEDGMTALILASLHGHDKVVDALLNARALVDAVDNRGRTSLICAAGEGYHTCVRMLVKHNANVSGTCSTGSSALMYATIDEHDQVISALLEAGADVNQMNVETTRRFEGYSALMFAAANGLDKMVNVLLDAKADPNKGSDRIHSRSPPLTIAAIHGHHRVVSSLIANGAELDKVNLDGSTALMLATSHKKEQCMRSLLEAGARCEVVDKDGKTALSMARMSGQTKLVLLLLHHLTGISSSEFKELTNMTCKETELEEIISLASGLIYRKRMRESMENNDLDKSHRIHESMHHHIDAEDLEFHKAWYAPNAPGYVDALANFDKHCV